MGLQYYNQLTKQRLSPDQHYVLYCYKNNLQNVLVNAKLIPFHIKILISLGYLTEDHIVTEKGEIALNSVDSVFRKTKASPSNEVLGDDYLEQIKIFREKFPKQRKATVPEITEKFMKFFLLYPSTTWSVVQKAVDIYLAEPREEKFIMKASNFVMVQRGGTNTYTLLEYCERVEEGDQPDEQNEVSMYKIS